VSDVTTQRAWLEGMSTHQQVIMRYALHSAGEVAEIAEAERRRADARRKGEDLADMARVGLAPAPRSSADVFAGFAAGAEIQDRIDESRRNSTREAWRRDVADQLTAQDAANRLAAERKRAEWESLRQLSKSNQLIAATRRRAEGASGYRSDYTPYRYR
jgi:hypothetical protein